MHAKILKFSIIAALAGFLFGFDTVVISGADKKLQALWESSDSFHGWVVMGMALWGTVIGALFKQTSNLFKHHTFSGIVRATHEMRRFAV